MTLQHCQQQQEEAEERRGQYQIEGQKKWEEGSEKDIAVRILLSTY